MSAAAGRPDAGACACCEVVIRVRDCGPAPVPRGSGEPVEPWCRYEAELPSYPVVSERGTTPWEAVFRLVGMHRVVLERRWSRQGVGDAA